MVTVSVLLTTFTNLEKYVYFKKCLKQRRQPPLPPAPFLAPPRLRNRRLEVVSARENGHARGRHACLLLARPFFLAPTTSKRLGWG